MRSDGGGGDGGGVAMTVVDDFLAGWRRPV